MIAPAKAPVRGAPFHARPAPPKSAPNGVPEPADTPRPETSSHPPGPPNFLRWLGLTFRHGLQLRFNALEYSTRLAHRYGKLTSFLLFAKRLYIVNDPATMHELLVRRRDDFIRAPWQMRVLRQIVGNGLLTSEGDLWLRQRRLLQQAFRPTAMPRYADLAVDTTRAQIDRWPARGRVDLVAEMASLAMTLSIRSTVGQEPDDLGGPSPGELAAAIVEGADILNRDMENPITPPDWAPLPSRRRKRKVIETIDRYLARAIATRRADPGERDDLLSLLLAAVDHDGDGRGMSDRLARDEAVTMVLAGNHASSAVLGWFWKLVLARPEVHRRLIAESDQVLAGRDATLADLPRLAYTKRVLQETLRLFPAAWVMFGRQAKRETTLAGYRVRRGGWVFAYPFITHRDPRFFPDPLRFDPERFSPERVGEVPEGAYFPFGHGPRVCIGQHLAMLQLTLIVATVLQRRALTPTPGCDDLTIRREFSIRPATPCWVNVVDRETDRPVRHAK